VEEVLGDMAQAVLGEDMGKGHIDIEKLGSQAFDIVSISERNSFGSAPHLNRRKVFKLGYLMDIR
jgi:hypothetical protein